MSRPARVPRWIAAFIFLFGLGTAVGFAAEAEPAAGTPGTEDTGALTLALTPYEPDFPTRPVSLAGAIVDALEKNRDLLVSRLNPDISRAREMAARGAFDLIISGSVNYERRTTQTGVEQSLTLAGQQPTNISRSLDSRVRISKPWITGTEIGIEGSVLRSQSTVSPREYSSSLLFTLRQSLLRGLDPRANLASIRQAQNNIEISNYQLINDTITVVSGVMTGYWNLALAWELMAVQKFSLDLAVSQMEKTEAFVELGRMPALEISSARAEVASRERDFIDAKNNLQITGIDFLLISEAGFDETGEYSLPRPDDRARLPELTGSAAESIGIALGNRPDLAQSYLDLENGRLDVVRTRDGLLPRLDFVGSYGWTGRGIQFHEARKVIDEGDFDQYRLGVDFEIPFPNRRARGDYRASVLTREQLSQSIENLRQVIHADVLKARIDLENQIAGVEASRASLRFQEEKLDAEEEKWRNGLSTNLEVFQAQRDLVNARNQLLVSIANVLKSEINLYVSEGSLLKMNGIEAVGGTALR